MNLSTEFVASGIILISTIVGGFLTAMRRLNGTADKVDNIESKAHKDKADMQVVIDNLYKKITEVQSDNAALLRTQLAMQERENVRETELGESKTDNLKLQMQVNEATRLKDLALSNEKIAVDLVEKQNKIITEANDTIASLQSKIHSLQLDLSIANGKLEGALAIAGVFKLQMETKTEIAIEESKPNDT